MATAPLKRSGLLATLRQLKPTLMESYGVTRVGIFGSVARDEATATSDVDVVVEMPPTYSRWCISRNICKNRYKSPLIWFDIGLT